MGLHGLLQGWLYLFTFMNLDFEQKVTETDIFRHQTDERRDPYSVGLVRQNFSLVSDRAK
jgi:hypothetical protein